MTSTNDDDGKPLKPIAGASVLKLDSRECFSCRLIGAGSLGLVGVYALHSSRPSQPGSVLGRRLMGGLGVCFLVASYMRWNSIGLPSANESQNRSLPHTS